MNKQRRGPLWLIREFVHRVFVVIGAMGFTLVFFLVLPLMQSLSKPPQTDYVLTVVDTALEPPPPPPPDEKPEEEPEPEEPQPELEEQSAPLDLAQLEITLGETGGGGWGFAEYGLSLKTVGRHASDVDKLFSLADLDQQPRVIYQPSPLLNKNLRKKAPGTVYVLFIVDQQGKVENPLIQKSTDPVFEQPALNAVKKWKFEPGKLNGKSVRFRMRVPITFPRG